MYNFGGAISSFNNLQDEDNNFIQKSKSGRLVMVFP